MIVFENNVNHIKFKNIINIPTLFYVYIKIYKEIILKYFLFLLRLNHIYIYIYQIVVFFFYEITHKQYIQYYGFYILYNFINCS